MDVEKMTNRELFHTALPCTLPCDTDPPDEREVRIAAQLCLGELYRRADRKKKEPS